MGNTGSRSGSRSSSPKRMITKRRQNSSSPSRPIEYRVRSESLAHPQQSARKLSSFRRDDDDELPVINLGKQRSKSFRSSSHLQTTRYGNTGRRKSDVCETTGLSEHQKVILIDKWRTLPPSLVLELGKRVFETMFERDPFLLAVLNLKHLEGTDEWRDHISFQVHTQRFAHTLSQCMHNMAEPVVAADHLQEFGAAYVEMDSTEGGSCNHIPHCYWDRLTAAISSIAKDMHDKSPQRGRKNSLSVDDALLANKDRLALQTNSTNIYAWNAFAAFVSNQIRFGYEMERMLRAELRKLGLNHERKAA